MGSSSWHSLLLTSILFLFLHFHLSLSSSFNLSSSPSSQKLCSPQQSFALIQFKKSIPVDSYDSNQCSDVYPHPRTESWKEDTDCCSWEGVTCDRFTGDVIGLDLSSSLLSGTINDNSSLFLLHHLQKLNLYCNPMLRSKISPKFSQFRNLKHLNLSFSKFTGVIPIEISHLSKLVSLDLSYGYFSAPELARESFSKILQNLTELRYLHLDGVNLSSVAPGSLVNVSSSLKSLSLDHSKMQGRFPDNVFHLPFLQRLSLSANELLTGNLPNSNWSGPLELLDVSHTSFSGELPEAIGSLKNLSVLNLYQCNFNGSIPTSLWNLTRIISLGFSSNNFTGQIPTSLRNLGDLTSLYLSDNMFSGQFPDVFSNLSKLTGLSLSSNNFSGQLPSSVFNLTGLTALLFSENQFQGQIPCQVSGLSELYLIDFSYNFLDGSIPFWLFTLQSLLYLHLQNNRLTGSLPSSKFELVNLFVLDLSSNNLSGIVDLDTFSLMKNLQDVNLSHNSQLSLTPYSSNNFSLFYLSTFACSSCNITDFPLFLRSAINLAYLDLSNNRISGHISQFKLGFLQLLHYLDLSQNLLTSFEQIPPKIENPQGPLSLLPLSIVFFSVSNNKLTGEIPLTLCNNFSVFGQLDFSSNGLSGTIPECLGKSIQLTHLDLRMNNLHGSIPESLGMSGIEYLNLNGNRLEGPLPSSFVNCSSLVVLDVGNNNINDTFPHWLASLPELQVLILRSNRFHGPIGDSNTTFPFLKLRILDLSNNRFNGHLPTRYFDSFKAMMQGAYGDDHAEYMTDHPRLGNIEYPIHYYSMTLIIKGGSREIYRILTIFTSMDLSCNLFEGGIPRVMGKLNSLKVLNFSHNKLTGHIIPSALENLTELESLDLSSNQFIGNIPVQLISLTYLSVLNLSYNQLVGSIPQGKQFNTFENDSFIGNLGLCGLPLSKKCDSDKAQEPEGSTEFHEEYDTSSWFHWKFAMMGYGCGLVIGLSIGYIVFATRKPQWFVRLVEGKRLTKMRRLRGSCKVRRNWG